MDIMLERILSLLGTDHGDARKMAIAIGAPKNAVTDWKAGRIKSYAKYAPQIAEYYGVSMDWLTGVSDIKNAPIDPQDNERIKKALEIYNLYQQVPDDKKEAAVAMLRGLIGQK